MLTLTKSGYFIMDQNTYTKTEFQTFIILIILYTFIAFEKLPSSKHKH